ncbi:hypothetical protein [Gellertiella hungarica]|uniref:Uncharacterized protein n=1 Tax=Gellertiella hungarica TaxID=1572859 RepID=A0A7W6J3Q8_9HYPH|nr:hypothetical protein [Gellertiella hungarica]MBB4064219.1 hypothetical protein [Gellertiella hungarica]
MFRAHTLLLGAIALVYALTYQWCLVPIYAYQGMRPLEMDTEFWGFYAFVIGCLGCIFPAKIKHPSDFFLFFYCIISVLWLSVAWSATDYGTSDRKWMLFAVMFIPALFLVAARRAALGILGRFVMPLQLGREAYLPFVLVLLLITGAALAFTTIGGGSLNWEEMYVRRHAARAAFSDNLTAAYFTGMATNGALPILGFIAGYRRSASLMFLCILFILLMFFLIGLKSPAINFAGLGTLGFMLSSRNLRPNLVVYLLIAVLGVYLTGLLVYLQSGNLFIADYLVRRISMLQPQIQSFYLDYWLSRGSDNNAWSAAGAFSDLTYHMGYRYMGNPDANLNTNTFIYALAKGGFGSYLFTIVGVVSVLLTLDVFYGKTRKPAFLALAALFSVLVSEQVWTTSLVTSGIALCIFLAMLFSYGTETRALRSGGDERTLSGSSEGT